MNYSVELTLEQQFSLRNFSDQVKDLSQEQAQAFLVELYKHMVCKEAMYNKFLKQKWGMDSYPTAQIDDNY